MSQGINSNEPVNLPSEIHILIANELSNVRDVVSFLLVNRTLSSLLLIPLYTLAARSSCVLTAILWAIVKKDAPMLRILLAHGPRGMTLKTKSGTVLHHVSWPCTDETVKRALGEGADLIITKRTGARKKVSGSVLHWVARIGHGKLLQLLLDSGANVAAVDQLGHTALHWAASMGHNEAVNLLLSHGSERLVRGKFGDTPLDRARYYNHHETVMLLLGGGPVNYIYRDHSTPLTLAASYPDDDIALSTTTSLLAQGSCLCFAGHRTCGPSALINAVTANNPKTMSLLLSAGENTIQWPGEFPLYKVALEAGHPELAYKLITTAPPRFRDTHGQSLLHMALTLPDCDTELIKSLCMRNVPVNWTNKYGRTPLTHATLLQNHSFVSLLISQGAQVNIAVASKKTLLHYAARGPADRWTISPPAANTTMIDIANTLIEAGADVNAQDDVGLSPLHEAVLGRSEAMVKLLLEAGADSKLRDYNWQTPFDLAMGIMDLGDEEAEIWSLLNKRPKSEPSYSLLEG